VALGCGCKATLTALLGLPHIEVSVRRICFYGILARLRRGVWLLPKFTPATAQHPSEPQTDIYRLFCYNSASILLYERVPYSELEARRKLHTPHRRAVLRGHNVRYQARTCAAIDASTRLPIIRMIEDVKGLRH
jgi:hypothetical protein